MDNLEFQEYVKKVPLPFRSFYGRNIDQMPLLRSGKDENGNVIDDARTPITIKQLLHYRVHGTNENYRTRLRENDIGTGDVTIVDPDGSGETIIGLYTNPIVNKLVNSLNPKSRLRDGTLKVSTEQYQAVRKEAFVLSPDVANALRENAYNEPKTREGFWNYVADGDESLVRDTLKLVQYVADGDEEDLVRDNLSPAQKKVKGRRMKNKMGLHLSSIPGLRLLCVGDVCLNSAYADALNLFGNYGLGRLVGVAAEPLARENLESEIWRSVIPALNEGKAFKYNGIVYAPKSPK